MNVIVSVDLADEYKNFKVIDDLKWVDENMEKIDVLILHTFREPEFYVGVYIAKLRAQGLTRFFYINNAPVTAVTMVVEGAGGVVVRDEFYLTDEEELNILLKEDETALIVTNDADADVQIVKKFLQAFVTNDPRIKAPVYLDQVNDAITSLATTTEKQSICIKDMGNSALAVFEKAHELITKLEEKRRKIEMQLSELEKSDHNSVGLTNTVMSYPPINYMRGVPLLDIRIVGECPFLLSYVEALAYYIRNIKNKSVKLAYILPKNMWTANKYKNWTLLNEQTCKLSSIYDNDTFLVFTPKKEVMQPLLEKPTDAFIFVDGLNNTDIVNGKIKQIYATNSLSSIETRKLNTTNVIASSIPIENADDYLCVLQQIAKYPTNEEARYKYYLQLFEASMENIYDRFFA